MKVGDRIELYKANINWCCLVAGNTYIGTKISKTVINVKVMDTTLIDYSMYPHELTPIACFIVKKINPSPLNLKKDDCKRKSIEGISRC